MRPVIVVGPHRFPPGAVGLMGVLNVTPDSFSDGGRFVPQAHIPGAHAVAVDAAVAQGLALAAHAEVVDVGGESTRPGAAPVPLAGELDRVIPVVRALAAAGVTVSIDTRKPEVADAACAAGAALINDVDGFRDPAMREVAARRGVAVCAMHMQGTPETMQRAPTYGDVVAEVAAFLVHARAALLDAGVAPERILVDPGIGFGKTLEHNLALLRNGEALEAHTGAAVLVGPSRKAFVGALTGQPQGEREWGTAGAMAAAALYGARVLRAHDVAAMRDVLKVAAAIGRQPAWSAPPAPGPSGP